MNTLDRHPALWLLLGIGLVAASQLRFGIEALAWVSWVPFLRYLRLRTGWRADLTVLATVVAAFTLSVLKIVTDPLPIAAAFGFGIPIGLLLGLPLVAFGRLRRALEPRIGAAATALLFPAAMVVGEWVQYALTELGNWGAAANTQLDDLALLQAAAITGATGVSFLVYLGNAALAQVLDDLRDGSHPRLAFPGAVAAALLVVHALGGVRLATFEQTTDTVRVAAVGTEATFGSLPLPSDAELAAIHDGIETRVRAAAAEGAEIVVWNEGSTAIFPDQGTAFRARWSALADELDIEMVTSWIVVVQTEPFLYENTSITFRPDGSATAPYLKHHPVPGEPAVPGTSPLPALDTAAGRVGTAICYDADFPRLGLGHARNDIDLLALPSSDWRGIDPIHTQMAGLRAIEGGYSVLRSTRLGLSAGIDASGRMRGWESAFDSGDKLLVVDLPRAGVWTPFRLLGDTFPALCALLVLAATGFALRTAAGRVSPGAWLRPSPSSVSVRS